MNVVTENVCYNFCMKLSIPEDCGNAPRKEFIRDFNIAFGENDTEKILSFMSDDIVWDMIGYKKVAGKEAVRKELESNGLGVATELLLSRIITHGDTAAANGVMKFAKTTMAFCDVYEFTGHNKNAKIKELTSYGIEQK